MDVRDLGERARPNTEPAPRDRIAASLAYDPREEFLDDCCAALGISLRELVGKEKHGAVLHVVKARKAAAWAMRDRFPELSYSMLGRLLKRDHTTVMYSVNGFAAALRAGESWAATLAARLPGSQREILVGLETALESLMAMGAE